VRLPPLVLAVSWCTSSGCSGSGPPAFVGFVDAPTSAVATQVAGQVESVLVREGDKVKKGQLVAKLDSREREALVAQAQANVEKARAGVKQAEESLRATVPTIAGAGADIVRAQATLDEAQQNYDRTKALAEQQATTQSELDTAQARLREAQASLDSLLASKSVASGRVQAAVATVSEAQAALHGSEAALEVAQVQLSETQVLAPFDGVVVERDLEPGEWAAPGTPVVTIEDRSRLWVRIDVEETRFAGLRLGEPAQIRVVALPGRVFAGHVIEVGAEGEFAINRDVKRGRPDIRTFRVRVAFDSPSDELRPGMTAEVRLGTKS
jgi:multidrug resistance efflux pump